MENMLKAIMDLGEGSGSMKDRLEAFRTEANILTEGDFEVLVSRKPIVEKSIGYGVLAYKFIKITCEFVKEFRSV